jgi:YbbR domain-containing protein
VLTLLRRNFGLKLLSVALAVAAWAYFHFSAAPGITAHFDEQLTVPLVVTGLRPGFVARYTDKTALVTIDLPRNGSQVKSDQVQAVLDLSTHPDPGVFNVPVEIIAPNVQIHSLTPASVTLTLDRLEERTVPVAIDYTGDTRGSVVVESADVNPSMVTIRGTANDLARVNAVRVEIPIPLKSGVIDTMTSPSAVDGRAGSITSVDVSPNLVRVRARFVPSTGTGAK